MTPAQALEVLSQATQPHAKLTRAEYVLVEQALVVLDKFLQDSSQPKAPAINPDPK